MLSRDNMIAREYKWLDNPANQRFKESFQIPCFGDYILSRKFSQVAENPLWQMLVVEMNTKGIVAEENHVEKIVVHE